MDQLLTARLIRYQFSSSPRSLNHLVTCYDNPPGTPEYHVVHGKTICGKNANYNGGWGYGPKDCPACFAVAAPAERIKYA